MGDLIEAVAFWFVWIWALVWIIAIVLTPFALLRFAVLTMLQHVPLCPCG